MNEYQPERDKPEVFLPPLSHLWIEIDFNEDKNKWLPVSQKGINDSIRADDSPEIDIFKELELLPVSWWDTLDRIKTKAEANKKFR
jgi:hypothetical protein